jgi:RNA-binding protein
MSLSSRQKKYLRGKSHALQPVVIIAAKGLTENVMAEIESALDHHELVKIKLRVDRDARPILIEEIANHCGAEKVHVIGQVACYFRRNPEKPVIDLPA